MIYKMFPCINFYSYIFYLIQKLTIAYDNTVRCISDISNTFYNVHFFIYNYSVVCLIKVIIFFYFFFFMGRVYLLCLYNLSFDKYVLLFNVYLSKQ